MTLSSHHSFGAAFAVALVALPLRASADPKAEAKQHLDHATELHKARRFTEALQEMQAAYTLDPQPALLYGIAQLDVKLGRCPDAIEFYGRFLASHPSAAASAAARHWIEVCKTNPPPAEASEPPPAPLPPAPIPVAAPAVAPPPPPAVHTTAERTWYSDKLGDVLLGAGIASGIVAAIEYSAARASIDDANRATVFRDHVDLVNQAHGQRTLAVGLAIGGGACVGAGLLHYALHARGVEDHGVAIAPGGGGGLVTWSGGF